MYSNLLMRFSILFYFITFPLFYYAQYVSDINEYYYYNNGPDACKKCFKGNISKTRKCDNCNGSGYLTYEKECIYCKLLPKGEAGKCILNNADDMCDGDCETCYGNGYKNPKVKCKECNNGYCKHCDGQGHVYSIKCVHCNNGKCWKCVGSGTTYTDAQIKCTVCFGTGKCNHKKYQTCTKCDGSELIPYIKEKNPNITLQDKEELENYINECKKINSNNAALKANEFFKANDFDKALQYYKNSIFHQKNEINTLMKDRVLMIKDSIEHLSTYNFNYLNFPKSGIHQFISNYKNQLFDCYFGPSTTCKIVFSSDLKGKLGLSIVGINNKKLVNNIIAKPFNYPEPATMYGYYVNATTEFEYKIICNTNPINLIIKNRDFKLKDRTVNITELKRIIPDSCSGKYIINVGAMTIDGITKTMTPEYINYKSFGGPKYALFSLAMPGLGYSLITRSLKGTRTLLFTGGFAALGYLLKEKTNTYYETYMMSQTQNEMDMNYKKYQNNFIGMNFSYCMAAAIWLYDIYRVNNIGKNNKLNEKRLNASLSINKNQQFMNLAIKF